MTSKGFQTSDGYSKYIVTGDVLSTNYKIKQAAREVEAMV